MYFDALLAAYGKLSSNFTKILFKDKTLFQIMGIWSEYKKSTTPEVKINIDNLKESTIEWIKCKGGELIYPEMTVDELGKSFCDTAKIWGYLENAEEPLNDIAVNINSDFATMIFSSDADYVEYFMLRFDKLLKKCKVLVHRTKEYPEKIEEIDWVEQKNSDIFTELRATAKMFLLQPGLSAKDREFFLKILQDS
jgi:hypothetical protein